MEEVPEDQPCFLFLLAETARVLGDPDWRILVHRAESYATGVPVGFMSRFPRTPSVYARKRRWRSYDRDDFCLELRDNYRSAAGAEADIKRQFVEEAKLGMMVWVPKKEAREEYGDRLRVAPMGGGFGQERRHVSPSS